jgi:hypothetical protein
MARRGKERGIQHWVTMLLDPQSQQRVERGMQDSLGKGTDSRRAKQNVDELENRFLRMAKRVGAALGVAFGLRALQRFGAESIRVAGAAEAIWSRLGGALQNVGVDISRVRGEIDDAAAAMQRVTTIGDEDFARGLTRLVTLTRDYSGSLQRMALVADVAAGAQIDVEAAADLVGKTLNGQTRELRRYGIVTNDVNEAMRLLQERFKGAAEREGRTLQGQLKRLNNEWGDFKQAVGEALIAAGGGTSVIETLIGGLRGLNAWVVQNAETIQWFGNMVVAQAGHVLDGMVKTINAVRGALERLQSAWRWFTGAAPPAEAHGNLDWGRYRRGKETPDPIIPIRPTATAAEKRAAESRISDLWAHLQAWEAKQGGLHAATSDLERRLIAERARRRAAAAEFTGMAAEFTGMGGSLRPVSAPGGPAAAAIREAGQFENVMRDMLANVEQVSQHAAYVMSSAFEDAFRTMMREGATVGNFFEGLGRGLAGAMLSGLAEVATGKAAENIARAIEAGAMGLMGHVGAAAAVPGFLGAAAAWSALAGGAGAGRSAVTGGRGHLTGYRDPGAGIAQRAEKMGAEIHINVDGVDPSNPRHQGLVWETARGAQERYGGTVYVNGRRQ